MARTKSFKGRVVSKDGSRITIDTKPESRTYKIPARIVDGVLQSAEIKTVASVWDKPDMPPEGTVVRCLWHRK